MEISGGFLVSSALDKSVKIWDEYGKPTNIEYCYKGVEKPINLKDGTFLTTNAENTIKIWDKTGKKCLKTIQVYGIVSLENKDGNFVGAANSTFQVWDMKGNVLIRSPTKGSIWSLIQRKDGRYAYGSDQDVVILDQKFNIIQKLSGHLSHVFCLIETKDGKLISGSSDKTIRIWNKNGDCLNTLRGHKDVVMCLFETKDGNILSGSTDENIMIWDKDGNYLETLKTSSRGIYSIIERKNGDIASGCGDYKIRIWKKDSTKEKINSKVKEIKIQENSKKETIHGHVNISNDLKTHSSKFKCIQTLKGHNHYVLNIIETTLGSILSSASDYTIKKWEKNGNFKNIQLGIIFNTIFLKKSKDGKIIMIGPNSIHIFDENAEKFLKKIDILGGFFNETFDEKFITYSNGSLHIWDNNGKLLNKSEINQSNIYCFCPLKNGSIAYGSNKDIYIIDKNLKLIEILSGHLYCVTQIIERQDGTLISAGEDNLIKIWKGETCINTILAHKNGVKSLIQTKDGIIVSGGGDSTIKFWDSKGNCIDMIECPIGGVYSIMERENGDIVAGGLNEITIWSKN